MVSPSSSIANLYICIQVTDHHNKVCYCVGEFGEVYKAHLIKWSGQGKSRIVAVKTLRGNHHVIIMITRHMNILSF